MVKREESYFTWNGDVLMLECLDCKHWNRYTGSRCKAFPQKIPMPILTGDVSHHKPYDGDNGIRFEPILK